jgi:hypothetical protein
VTNQVSDLPTLLLKFLSTQASDIIKSKNVVPYSDMPRFLSQYTAQVLPFLAGGAPVRQTSQNLQLNQIPSKVLICVRKPLSAQTGADSSTFLTITGLSVNFNNASGLLSSSSMQDLWRMSARNGSNQTWSQFSGVASKVGAYAAAANGVSLIGTGGSLIVLNPAFDLSLPDFCSNGSLGQFNLQFDITCINQYGAAVVPEIVVVCINSGIMTTQSGVTSTFTGVLTKDMVMSAKAMPAISSAIDREMVGGRMLNNHRFAHHKHHAVHHHAIGGNTSGGSGGASSGGGRHALHHLLK